MTLEETRKALDTLVQRGQLVAMLRLDGEVGYWPIEAVAPEQLKSRLSIQQVQALRIAQSQPKGLL